MFFIKEVSNKVLFLHTILFLYNYTIFFINFGTALIAARAEDLKLKKSLLNFVVNTTTYEQVQRKEITVKEEEWFSLRQLFYFSKSTHFVSCRNSTGTSHFLFDN